MNKTNINVVFEQSILAAAAYANFGVLDKSSTTGVSIDTDTLEKLGMSSAEAKFIAKAYKVVAQYSDITGVSATVFCRTSDGAQFLAVRGTEPKDPRDLTADVMLATVFPSIVNLQFPSLKAQVEKWCKPTTDENGNITAPAVLTTSVSVCGHSLGGFLAAALKQQLPETFTQAYLFNAPGDWGLPGFVADAARKLVGISTDNPDILNIKGTGGVSAITGSGYQLGTRIDIEEESYVNPRDNHGSNTLALALAVKACYATIIPQKSDESDEAYLAKLNVITRCASKNAGTEADTFLALQRWLNPDNTLITQQKLTGDARMTQVDQAITDIYAHLDDGGKGTDTMYGNAGADTYQFRAGDGADTVTTNGGADIADFLDISSAGALFKKSGNNLVISVGADSVTVINGLVSGSELASLHFTNGNLTMTDVRSRLMP